MKSVILGVHSQPHSPTLVKSRATIGTIQETKATRGTKATKATPMVAHENCLSFGGGIPSVPSVSLVPCI